MIVSNILQGAYDSLGYCDPIEKVFDRIQRAMGLLQNESNWDPQVGFMDVCAQDCIITLPDEVEIVLSANVGGTPSDFRNKWFEFHLNGPGSSDCCSQPCTWAWADQGGFPTYRDLRSLSNLAAFSDDSRDGQAAKQIKVYGWNQNGIWINTDWGNSGLEDGFPLPIFSTYATGVKVDPPVYRIQRLLKPVTAGNVKIIAYDNQTQQGVQVAYMKPWETEAAYRRIKITGGGGIDTLMCGPNECCTQWVRLGIRRKQLPIRSVDDVIFLHSDQALYMAIQAIAKYEANLIDEGDKYLDRAIGFLESKEKILQGPNRRPMQMKIPAMGGNVWSNLI